MFTVHVRALELMSSHHPSQKATAADRKTPFAVKVSSFLGMPAPQVSFSVAFRI